MFETQLFEGELVRLTAVESDKDAPVESKWTEDIDYLRAINMRPAYPLSAHLVKKQYEEYQKSVEKNQLFYWALRAKDDGRLIGWAKLSRFEWTHGSGDLALAIGAPADRNRGMGSDALRLVLRFAFDELNMHRLRAMMPDYNDGAQRFFKRFGFVEEVRRREALLLNGQRYDDVWFGILRNEWQERGKPS